MSNLQRVCLLLALAATGWLIYSIHAPKPEPPEAIVFVAWTNRYPQTNPPAAPARTWGPREALPSGHGR